MRQARRRCASRTQITALLLAISSVAACDNGRSSSSDAEKQRVRPAEPKTPKTSTQAQPDPIPALQCFSDNNSHEICVPIGPPPVERKIYIDGAATNFLGDWTPREARAPKLNGKLGAEAGASVHTGPNGALRVQCRKKAIRQYFKGRIVEPGRYSVSGAVMRDPTLICQRLEL